MNNDLKCKTCIYYSEVYGCDKMIMDPKDDWIKHCPVYKQKDLYEQNEQNELKLVDVNALLEHLNTTMYRDVIEEIKNFPTITPVLARQVNGTILLIPTRTFEDIKNGTISSIEIRGEEQ